MKWGILMSLLLFPVLCSAQNYKENIKHGKEAFQDGDYAAAASYFQAAYVEDSTDIGIAWKIAEAHRMFNDYKPAMYWYREVYSRDERGSYRESLFWLAMMYKSNGMYNEAAQSFGQFAKLNEKNQDYFYTKAKREIDACHFAQTLMEDTLPVVIRHLSEEINTPYADFGAFQVNKSTLEYSSMRILEDVFPEDPIGPTYFANEIDTNPPVAYFAKIYHSEVSGDFYSPAVEYDHDANAGLIHAGNSCYSKDKKRYYFTLCEGETPANLKCKIYFCKYEDGQWTDPKALPEKINVAGNTATQPCVGTDADGKEYLYYVSDREGGQGGLDIWYAEIKSTGNVGSPQNAGDVINSIENEVSPWYDDSTGTLYFSSTWLFGLGNYDIFKVKGSAKKWEKPENIGYPINTSYNDVYFSINETDSNGYITSNRPGSFYIKGETCCNDIFEYKWIEKKEKKDSIIPVAVVVEKTIETQIRELLPISLFFHNDEPDPKNLRTSTSKTYEETYFAYTAMISEYQEQYSTGLSGDKINQAKQDIADFFTDYVEAGYNKLKEYTVLLSEDLKAGKTVRITVKGYCSPRANNSYNKNLAKRRISSMINYLKTYGDKDIADYVGKKGPSGGELYIVEEPLGEEYAAIGVSDNLNDLKNSVYSRSAALERKIVILKYDSEDEKAMLAKIDEVVFKVQISSSSTQLPESQFTGISPITSEKMPDGRYCYYAGFFNNFDEAAKAQQKLRKSGYSSAFVIATRNGIRISLNEAVEYAGQQGKTQNHGVTIKNNQITPPDDPVKKTTNGGITDITKTKGLIYTLQLCAVSSPNSASAFNGLSPLYVEKASNGFYRYFYGKYSTQSEAGSAKANAREAGFDQVFLVAYYNGKKIGLQEAVKYE